LEKKRCVKRWGKKKRTSVEDSQQEANKNKRGEEKKRM